MRIIREISSWEYWFAVPPWEATTQEMVEQPLKNPAEIEARLDGVEELKNRLMEGELKELLDRFMIWRELPVDRQRNGQCPGSLSFEKLPCGS